MNFRRQGLQPEKNEIQDPYSGTSGCPSTGDIFVVLGGSSIRQPGMVLSGSWMNEDIENRIPGNRIPGGIESCEVFIMQPSLVFCFLQLSLVFKH